MSTREEKHAKLDALAAQIKEAERDCEAAYRAWSLSAHKLKQLERQSRGIWLSMFDELTAAPAELTKE